MSSNQDALTELFAHCIVLQRRSATLVELLGSTDVSLDAIREMVSKVHAQTSELEHLVNHLTAGDAIGLTGERSAPEVIQGYAG